MTQKSLHDYFKVKGPLPKIKIKSPKVLLNRSKMSITPTKKSPGTPSRKRIDYNTEWQNDEKIQIVDEINLEDMAITNINTAIEYNHLGEIELNQIYDTFSNHRIKLIENCINYKGYINPLNDKSAESLFRAIFVDVFLNKINCELFNQNELKLIMSIFKLSVKSKVILTRLIKWKKPWYRIREINDSLYNSNINDFPLDEITFHSNDDNGIFKILNCDDDIEKVLQSMNARELRNICKRLKQPHTLSKEKIIGKLLDIGKINHSLFPGTVSPRSRLLSMIAEMCGPSIQLSDTTLSIVERLSTLAYPVQSRFETFQDVIWMITEVDMGKRMYPTFKIDHYPVFRSRQHVIDYVEAKNALIGMTVAMKLKKWSTVKKLSTTAYEKLMTAENVENNLVINKKDLTLPSSVRRFTASFVWSKVLMLSIDSPKNDPDYAIFVGQFLKSLLNFDGVVCASNGRCYSELSAVEMKYHKNFDECARLIECGLLETHLSILVEADLIDRARKLAARVTGISDISKNLMTKLYNEKKEKFECSPMETFIEAKKMQSQTDTIAKSVWLLNDEGDSNTYAQVEVVAQSHYMKNGFLKGLHCESALPITLCACAFWNEIYNVSIPGAFICRYQQMPLDLFSSTFIANRQEEIQQRIGILNDLNVEDFCEMIHHNYISYREYTSLINSNLFHETGDIEEIIRCMGTKKVIGLCLIILNDFYIMRAGFPDLIVWNPHTSKCKIIEVKGPGDSLSIKQKLWINRLIGLGIDTEVCYVKAK